MKAYQIIIINKLRSSRLKIAWKINMVVFSFKDDSFA